MKNAHNYVFPWPYQNLRNFKNFGKGRKRSLVACAALSGRAAREDGNEDADVPWRQRCRHLEIHHEVERTRHLIHHSFGLIERIGKDELGPLVAEQRRRGLAINVVAFVDDKDLHCQSPLGPHSRSARNCAHSWPCHIPQLAVWEIW